MIDEGRVTRIKHSILGSTSIALKNIKILEPFILKSNLFRALTGLYGGEKIKMAWQKILVKSLSAFHSVQLVLSGAGSGKIVFYPFSYLRTYSIIKRHTGLMQDLDNVKIPWLFKFFNTIDLSFEKLKSWFISNGVNLSALALLLMKLLSVGQRKPKKEYAYAVAITNSNFQFRFTGHRAFDFILDGKQIRKENTVFLALSPISSTNKQGLDELGYQIIDCRRREVFFSPRFRLSKSESLSLIVKGLKYVLKNLYFSLFESKDNVYGSHTLFKTYLLWNIILNNIRFEHFITFNDEGMSSVGRNILLNKYGVTTWHYAHSCSFGYLLAKGDMSLGMSWYFSLLFYDHYIAWNKPTIDYLMLHNQGIGQYHNVGCLWSGFGVNDKEAGGVQEILRRGQIKGKNPQDCRVISFFDTTFYDCLFSYFPLEDGVRFYRDIEKYLQEEPGVFVIVKEKKDRRMYSDQRNLVYSKSHKEFFAQLEILQSHPRCFVAGHAFNPGDIIKISDLTVTYTFSSITVEALSARRKAIFYDPAGRFQGCFYDAIPGFVAHGYEELKLFIKKMLGMSENEFDEFLDVWGSPRLEDYRDGKALDRFRELLTHSGK